MICLTQGHRFKISSKVIHKNHHNTKSLVKYRNGMEFYWLDCFLTVGFTQMWRLYKNQQSVFDLHFKLKPISLVRH